MCLAIPGRVKEISKMEDKVDYPKEVRTVLVGEKAVKVGDYVLVQMGVIIKKISKAEAETVLNAWKEMGKKLQ